MEFNAGDVVYVNGTRTKGFGQVESTLEAPPTTGEMGYQWSYREAFPQMRIDLPTDDGRRSGSSGVHMNGDDLAMGKVRLATAEEREKFFADFPAFAGQLPERIHGLFGNALDDACARD